MGIEDNNSAILHYHLAKEFGSEDTLRAMATCIECYEAACTDARRGMDTRRGMDEHYRVPDRVIGATFKARTADPTCTLNVARRHMDSLYYRTWQHVEHGHITGEQALSAAGGKGCVFKFLQVVQPMTEGKNEPKEGSLLHDQRAFWSKLAGIEGRVSHAQPRVYVAADPDERKVLKVRPRTRAGDEPDEPDEPVTSERVIRVLE